MYYKIYQDLILVKNEFTCNRQAEEENLRPTEETAIRNSAWFGPGTLAIDVSQQHDDAIRMT